MFLRQVAFAARDLAGAESGLRAALGVELVYRDPEVAYFGLENALFACGDQFLELVSPVRDDAPAARFLARRGVAAAGYMLIFQCADASAESARLAGLGLKPAFSIEREQYVSHHYHPRDFGGVLVSVDSMPGEPCVPSERWLPAGAQWRRPVGAGALPALRRIDVAAAAPAGMAARWAELLARPALEGAEGPELATDGARIRFVAPEDDGAGIRSLYFAADRGRSKAATLCGVPIEIGEA